MAKLNPSTNGTDRRITKYYSIFSNNVKSISIIFFKGVLNEELLNKI